MLGLEMVFCKYCSVKNISLMVGGESYWWRDDRNPRASLSTTGSQEPKPN